MPDAEKLAAVREALPALVAGIYLNTASVGPLPAEVAAAMDEYAARELRTGRGHPDDIEAGIERIAEARAGVAAILATDVEAVRLTHGAAEGIRLAIEALDWQPGDRLLTSSDETADVAAEVAAVAGRRHVAVDRVELPATGGADATATAFADALGPRTRLVVTSHVLPTTGARLPIEAIATAAHDHGASLVVDGSRAVGAIPVAVDEIGADGYAVAGETWLLGPEGTGALWLGGPLLERVGANESGFHKPSVVGFARSCGWLSMYVGLPWVVERGTSLAADAAARLAAIDGVTVLTPSDALATIVTFRIRSWPAGDALRELGSRVFAIAAAVPGLEAIRISVGFFTSEAELERFASAVELLAAHTPDTLPPKPRLTVIGQDER